MCTSSKPIGTILVLLAVCLFGQPAHAKYSGGTGEPNDPYQIATPEDLIALGETPEDYDKHFIMTADIDLDPNLPGRKVFDKAVIAPDTNDANWRFDGTPFTGVFDGNDHTISHLTITSGNYLGLFGRLESGAEVKNLGVVDVNISGSGDYVGGLVGENGGTVTHCYSTGTLSGGVYLGSSGGLVGFNSGSITTSYSSTSVIGDTSVGGLVGTSSGAITMSYSIGTVTGGWNVGGLVGENFWGNIGTSYCTAAVSGATNVGGLVGHNWAGAVTDCYSTGAVSGDVAIGGLVGVINWNPARVTHSVWDMETSGLSRSPSVVGLTTAEMMDPYMLGLNGFSDDPNWILDAGRDYPRLAWEGTDGDIIPKPEINWIEGQGTAEDPYRIETTEQLILLGKASILWDRHFVLGADIDLYPKLHGGQVFAQAVIPTFSGVFDGNGHSISRLTITGDSYLGLFGMLEPRAEVKDLGVVDVNITGRDIVGGLAGYNGDGSITKCYSSGTISASGSSDRWSGGVGGLVGYNDGTVTDCYVNGSVTTTGDTYTGGLIGDNGGRVTQCFSAGSVSGNYSVGGLVGTNPGEVTDCYSTTTVNGDSSVNGNSVVGGLVGQNYKWGRRGALGPAVGFIARCYSSGSVSGDGTVGGLVGRNADWYTEGVVNHGLWDAQTSGQATSAGGTGKTTAEMQTARTFLEAGWDFVSETANGTEDIWWINEGKDYPRLSWETHSN